MQRKALRATVAGQDADVPIGAFTDQQVMIWDAATNTFKGVTITAGTGDVVGPASSINRGIATFNGLTGKLIQDNGVITINGGSFFNVSAISMSANITGVTTINGVDITNLDARLNPAGADTMFPGTYAAGDHAAWSGTQWDPKFQARGFNGGTQVCAVTTLADMTNHTFALPRAGTYDFKLRGVHRTNATTTALRISANYSGTTTSYNGALETTTGAAGAVAYNAQTTLNTAMGPAAGPGAVDTGFEFWGRIVVSTAGTFAFRIASSVAVAAGVTLAVGATSELWQQ